MKEKAIEKTIAPEKTPKPKKKWCLCCGLIVLLIIILSIVSRVIYLSYYEKNSTNSDRSISNSKVADEVKSAERSSVKSNSKSTADTSQKDQESEQPENTQTQENRMLEYFIDTAVYDYQKREFFITRWTSSNVSVGVAEGSFTESLNNCLESFINDFNSESSSAKLRRDDTVDVGIPNIKIYYWDDTKFKEKAGQNATYGLTQWIHKDDKSLQRSMLFLSYDLMNADESLRCQIIRHEMMHAVGFWGHSDKYFEGIMSSPKTRYIYPDEDKRLVRILYNSNIPVGSDNEAARNYFGNNSDY